MCKIKVNYRHCYLWGSGQDEEGCTWNCSALISLVFERFMVCRYKSKREVQASGLGGIRAGRGPGLGLAGKVYWRIRTWTFEDGSKET